MKPMDARRHELLASTADLVERVLRDHGIADEVASQAGAAVADAFAEEHAGQVLYIPYDHAYKLAPRDREILELHRQGTTISELRKRYKMSELGLKKLLRRAASREPHLNQQQLFGS